MLVVCIVLCMCHLAAAYLLRRRPPLVALGVYYALVDFIVGIQWTTVERHGAANFGYRSTCYGVSSFNAAISSAVHILTVAHPLVCAIVGLRYVSPERFVHPLLVSSFYVAWALWGVLSHVGSANPRYVHPFACATVGPNGYMEWRDEWSPIGAASGKTSPLGGSQVYALAASLVCAALYRGPAERANTLGWVLAVGWALAGTAAVSMVGTTLELLPILYTFSICIYIPLVASEAGWMRTHPKRAHHKGEHAC